jgi:hypothetical protein
MTAEIIKLPPRKRAQRRSKQSDDPRIRKALSMFALVVPTELLQTIVGIVLKHDNK